MRLNPDNKTTIHLHNLFVPHYQSPPINPLLKFQLWLPRSEKEGKETMLSHTVYIIPLYHSCPLSLNILQDTYICWLKSRLSWTSLCCSALVIYKFYYGTHEKTERTSHMRTSQKLESRKPTENHYKNEKKKKMQTYNQGSLSHFGNTQPRW